MRRILFSVILGLGIVSSVFAQAETTTWHTPLDLSVTYPSAWATLAPQEAAFVVLADSTATLDRLAEPRTAEEFVVQVYRADVAAADDTSPAAVLDVFGAALDADGPLSPTEDTLDGRDASRVYFANAFGVGEVLALATDGGEVVLAQAMAADAAALDTHRAAFEALAASVIYTLPVPELARTYNGSGRLNGVTFSYPDDWHTLPALPVNRRISFNVVSSIPIGPRTQLAGQEAIVLALAGGRIDRWNELEPDDSLTDMLNTFFEALGDNDRFGPNATESGEVEYAQVVTPFTTTGGYEAIRMQFVPETAVAPSAEDSADTDEFSGEFVAYALRLDDNRFLIVMTLVSEYRYAQVAPLLDAILNSLE